MRRAYGRIMCVAASYPRLSAVVLLFLALTGLRATVLTCPPYWDAIVGPFAEATWLKNNGFDYWRLVHSELRFPAGGPAVYVWSVLPSLYALLLLLFSPATVFAILHVANFLFASIIGVTLYGLMRDLLRVQPIAAGLATAAVLAQPAFGGQIDAVNMEMAATLVIVLTASALLRGRYRLALVYSLIGVFVKDAIALLCLANLVFVALLVISGRERRRVLALCTCAVPIVVRFTVKSYVFSFEELGPGGQFLGVFSNLEFLGTVLTACVPDVLVIFFVTVGMGLHLCSGSAAPQSSGKVAALPRFCDTLLDRLGPVYVYCLIVAGGFLCFMVALLEPLPRYFVWYLPFFFLGFAAVIQRSHLSEKAKALCFCIPAVVGALNGSGVLYPPLPRHWSRSGELLERSREYIQDVRSNQALAKFVAENLGDHCIVATCPMDRMLTMPEVGYVSRPLDVYTVWTKPTYVPVKSCELLRPEDTSRMALVYKPTVFNHGNPVSLAPGPKDVILFADSLRGGPAIVYKLAPPSGEEEQGEDGAGAAGSQPAGTE